jgi:hypothetical protein
MPVLERYIPGNHWIISDISGQKIRIKDAVRDWRNLYMEKDNFSPKEKQLTITGRQEHIAVTVARTQNIDETLQDPPFDPATDAI